MDVDTLRTFIAFVDTGSFTRAAKQTFRTQSAISMQMKKLEEEVGHDLFFKEGRNLALTEQGQQLVSYARRILALHDDALAHFSESMTQPPIIIGCPDDYAESILPSVIRRINAYLPELNIRVVCDCSTELRRKLDAGTVDIAILTRSPEVEEGYLIRHDTGVWVAGEAFEFSRDRAITLALYEPDCKFYSAAIDGLEKQGQDYRILCSTASATAIKALLRENLAISAMASSSVGGNLSVLMDHHLPQLPSVDIVMAVAPIPHALFGTHMAAKICQELFEQKRSRS
ncbi:LysR family transcriptional regulator [Marinomonas mediterranea]|uniref:LysR family transcriptional regulator n=1 Tax=Marinomonas mediterranea TaxID=119864 RepID=UPI00234AD9AA|nr:LysR family transcriptional regulator [Marinomonas mediterranea]WCN10949.1 LysR family transcriptional regulator [Marinomonas mediterranea]WCN15011.1 LysR family transcriptional regulator [Marinomonas mediterranea]